MSMLIIIDGQGFEGFTQATVSRSIFHASGHFKFTFSPQNQLVMGANSDNYPLKTDKQCTIQVNNQDFLTGFSDNVVVNRSDSQVSTILSGRDRTMDLIDSTLDANVATTFNATGLTLKQISEKIITKLGIKDVAVIDTVGTAKFKKGETIIFQQGETGIGFLQKYANMQHVLLSTDGKGNLTIVNGSTTAAAVTLSPSVMVSSELMLDTSKQFNEYVCYSQTIVANDIQNLDKNSTAGNKNEGTVVNATIRPGRKLVFIADTPLATVETKDRATWESNFRQSMGFRYTVVVKDFVHDGGKIWEPNLTVNVNDPFVGLNSKLIIETVTFEQSMAGLKTILTMVPPDAFQLRLAEDYRQSLSNQSSAPFSGLTGTLEKAEQAAEDFFS